MWTTFSFMKHGKVTLILESISILQENALQCHLNRNKLHMKITYSEIRQFFRIYAKVAKSVFGPKYLPPILTKVINYIYFSTLGVRIVVLVKGASKCYLIHCPEAWRLKTSWEEFKITAEVLTKYLNKVTWTYLGPLIIWTVFC